MYQECDRLFTKGFDQRDTVRQITAISEIYDFINLLTFNFKTVFDLALINELYIFKIINTLFDPSPYIYIYMYILKKISSHHLPHIHSPSCYLWLERRAKILFYIEKIRNMGYFPKLT